jgi:hypothetical protein
MKPETIQIKKFAGLRSQINKERMSVGDLVAAINVRIDETGQASRRRGFSTVIATHSHSLWSQGPMTLGVVGGNLVRINPGYSTTVLASGLQGHAVYETVEDRVYWSSANACGVIDGGVNRSWGLEVPVPIIGQSAGRLPAGLYQAVATFRRKDKQESGASATFTLSVPADGGISIAAPTTTDPDIEACELYISTPGGATLYRAGECAPGDSFIYTGDSTDLVIPLQTQFMDRAVPCGAMAYYSGRMWIAVGAAIYPSEAFAPELFDYRNDVPFAGTVRMIAPQRGDGSGMFIGTDAGVVYAQGADPDTLQVSDRMSDPVLAGSLVYVPGELMGDGELAGQQIPVWATTKSFCAGMPDGAVRTLTINRHPLSLRGPAAMYFDADLKQLVLSSA